MKKNKIIVLLAAMMLLPLFSCSQDDDFEFGDVRCEIIDGTVTFNSAYFGHFDDVFYRASSKALVSSLTISGDICSDDIYVIGDFSQLQKLDLSKARIYSSYYYNDYGEMDVIGGSFGSANMREIILPETLKEIECSYCFSSCKNLREVIILSPNFVTLSWNKAFNDDTYKYGVLFVPEGRAEHYKADRNWSQFAKILEHRNGIPIDSSN